MSLEFDYVIVGGGTAGCVLAQQLIALELGTVAIIEIGQAPLGRRVHVPALYPHCFNSRWDHGYRTTPQKELMGRRLHWPRGKMLGGSSGINAMIYTRCSPFDFESWPADWNYESIQHSFRAIEEVLFKKDDYSSAAESHSNEPYLHPLSLAFLQAASEAGLDRVDLASHDLSVSDSGSDHCLEAKIGSCIYTKTIHAGRRFSAYRAFLKPILNSKRLSIFSDVIAKRIVFDQETAKSVECVDLNKSTDFHFTARKAIILCAGALESPALLQRSGIGPQHVLEKNKLDYLCLHEGVGRNLQDHLIFPVIYQAKNRESLERQFSDSTRMQYVQDRSGPLTSNLAEVGAFMLVEKEKGVEVSFTNSKNDRRKDVKPNIQLHFTPTHYFEYPIRPLPTPAWTVGVTPLHPFSRGTIELDSQSNEKLLVDPRYLTDPRDMETMIDGIARSMDIASRDSLALYSLDQLIPGKKRMEPQRLPAAVRAFSTTIYHPVGTCSMGTAADSVVDSQLRVHGLTNLYVADASVIPTMPSGNPQAIVMMIAHRLASFLG